MHPGCKVLFPVEMTTRQLYPGWWDRAGREEKLAGILEYRLHKHTLRSNTHTHTHTHVHLHTVDMPQENEVYRPPQYRLYQRRLELLE
jgi:hypothetical protein